MYFLGIDPVKKKDKIMVSRAQQTIMVVEDFEDNRFLMRKLLETSGYRVLEATNGQEAVTIAEHERPDLVLMDLSLPVLDGLAATRRMRDCEVLKSMPIVAVSAHDTTDFHSEAISAGCNAYIAKPIDFDQLQSVIDRLLDEASDRPARLGNSTSTG